MLWFIKSCFIIFLTCFSLVLVFGMFNYYTYDYHSNMLFISKAKDTDLSPDSQLRYCLNVTIIRVTVLTVVTPGEQNRHDTIITSLDTGITGFFTSGHCYLFSVLNSCLAQFWLADLWTHLHSSLQSLQHPGLCGVDSWPSSEQWKQQLSQDNKLLL